MDYEEKQVVSLKDIFFGILYHWKSIVVAMLIGALLLGGVAFYRSPIDNSQEAIEDTQNLAQQILIKQNTVNNQEEYLKDSYLLNVDPYNLYEVSVSFYISSDYQILPQMIYQNPDSTPALLIAYQSLLSDRTLVQSIADTAGIGAKYVSELLTSTTTNGHPGILTVNIIHQDADKATAITALIQAFLENHTESLQKQLGNHTLTVISTVSGPSTNNDVASQQKKATEYLATLRTELEQLEKSLSTLESSSSGFNIPLMAVVGGMVGFVLAVIVFFLLFMGSGKVYSDQALINRTGIKILGCVASSKKRCCITRRLRKIEGRSMNPQDIHIPAAIISNHCTDMRNLLIAGNCDETTLKTLQDSLPGLQVSYFDSLLNNADALKALPQCDAVVLLETCATSTYSDVERTMACIADHNKQLLGCILIDG